MSSTPQPRVFGTGLVALDLVVGLDLDEVRVSAGGSCGNVLAILAYLGWTSFPVARLNGDAASKRVQADLETWDVRLDFVSCGPTAHTPIVVQQLRRGRDGTPKHRFFWSCPQCGEWLPGYKPVTREAIDMIAPKLSGSSVFYIDRLSPAGIALASEAARNGALVVFEPSGRATERLMCQALKVAHVVKYSNQRLSAIDGVMATGSTTLAEIQTLGARGLRYRHRLGRSKRNWIYLNAIPAPKLVDTCGSGDWCTAGLIAAVGGRGLGGFVEAGARGLREALRYGQTLAAWNCAYEGARGGMYVSSRSSLDTRVEAILAGELDPLDGCGIVAVPTGPVACPACPA